MTKKELIDGINSLSNFNKYNGIVVTDVGDDYSVVEGELNDNAKNPWGSAHGGFIYSLCDVAAGVVVSKGMRKCVTLSGNIRYLHASKGSKLRVEGKIIKDGSNVVYVETSVYDDNGQLTAKGDFDIFVLKPLTEGKT